jgi:hypothetical protein
VFLQRRLVQSKPGLLDLDDDRAIGMPKIWMWSRHIRIRILAFSRTPTRRPPRALPPLDCTFTTIVRGPVRRHRLTLLARVGLTAAAAATTSTTAPFAPLRSRSRRLAVRLLMTMMMGLLSFLVAFLRL